MIYPMVPFPVTLSLLTYVSRSRSYALEVLCAQLTRDLFAIAKFLLDSVNYLNWSLNFTCCLVDKFQFQYSFNKNWQNAVSWQVKKKSDST